MIAVLDPGLFIYADPLTRSQDSEIKRIVDDAALVCKATSARVPAAQYYWRPLYQKHIAPLITHASPSLRAALDGLRTFVKPVPLPDVVTGKVHFWGVKPLFGDFPPLAQWQPVMEQLTTALAVMDEPAMFVTRSCEGRNQLTTQVDHCKRHEKTRWRIYVQITHRPLRYYNCVRHPRNIQVPWSIRTDERLPAELDNARYPFCPPDQWWKRKVEVVGTHTGKPAWIDTYGRGWTRPNTPGAARHWDVFLDQKSADAIGLDQLNVADWGAPSSEVPPGAIHHVPQDKRPHFKNDSGWSCCDAKGRRA